MSGPVPSPSTKGMIGRSGTFSTPLLNSIASPRGGTLANLYFVIGLYRFGATRTSSRERAGHKTSRMTLNSVFGVMSQLNRILQTTICASMLSVVGCQMGPPSINGAPGAPPAPNLPWKPPAGAIKQEPLITAATALAVPPDLEQRIQQLALADVVDLALRNNPATRASWAQARASADLLGSARGQYYPSINGSATVSRI